MRGLLYYAKATLLKKLWVLSYAHGCIHHSFKTVVNDVKLRSRFFVLSHIFHLLPKVKNVVYGD